MTIRTALRPAVPMAVGTAAALVSLVVASRALPAHVVLVHLEDTGGSALAASRDDTTLLGLVAVALLVGGYLVAALVLAITPARHVLVPHAAYWKTASRRREMRRRYQSYVSVAFGGAQWFVAALLVLALVSQSGPLSVWWLPMALSALFVLAVLIGLVWVFTAGFTPPVSAARDVASSTASSPRTSTSGRQPSSSTRSSAPATRTAGERAAASGGGPSATPRADPARPNASRPGASRPGVARPGAARSNGPASDGKPPARPYQPRPRDGGSNRG